MRQRSVYGLYWLRRRRPLTLGVLALAIWASIGIRPRSALAHERWFVESRQHDPVDWTALWSLPVLVALIAAVATGGVLRQAQVLVADRLWPRLAFLPRLEPAAAAILGVQTAITIIFGASRLELFVPPIELPRNVIGVVLAIVAVVAAFSFITGVLTRVGALIVVALWVLAFGFAPGVVVVEQTIFVGIALYLFAIGREVQYATDEAEPDLPFTGIALRLQPWALTILRIGTGLSILIVAFTEKLINVDLGIAFLQEYPRFNVARELGFEWFTDRRFVFAAGIVEAVAGVALLSGYLPRVVIAALWIPFNLGIAFLPPQELVGHLPILASMYVLLVQGTEGIPLLAGRPAPSASRELATRPGQP